LEGIEGEKVETTNLKSRFLYESGQYLGINKLPGEAVEGAGPGMIDLPRLLTEHYGAGPEKTRPFPVMSFPAMSFPAMSFPAMSFPVTAVHRLEVPVSGCVLFARTPDALAAASALFAGTSSEAPPGGEEGGVEKQYWAIIEAPRDGGSGPLADSGELAHWILRDGRHNKSFAYDESGPDRKRGLLRYRIAGRGEHYLFLEIVLLTGRQHQIRAQLAALGLHIKGDLKYGARRSEKNGGIRLHARSLVLQAGGESIRLIAPPPIRDRLWEDFERCADEKSTEKI
jgi:23S rRNA pseudouridine1911/1915/1917 synthase